MRRLLRYGSRFLLILVVVVSLAPLCLPQATAQNPYSSALSPSVVATSAFAGGCPDTKCVSQSSNTCSPQVGTVCHVIEVHKCRTIVC